MKLLFSIIVILLFVSGVSTAQTDLPDTFTPCTGYSENIPPNAVNAGPWANRLMLAFSEDGLTWEKTNTILSDQADVPDVIVTAEGEIRVYHIVWCPDEVNNRIAVASSIDAETWEFRPVTITREGNQPLGMPADPTIEIGEDGEYRLYFTAQIPPMQYAGSHVAVSDDGYHFTYVGEVFSTDSHSTLDVNVLQIGDMWHYFAGGIPGENFHGVSEDGLNFTRVDDFVNDSIIMSNGVAVEGGYRYYGFKQMPGDAYIVSFFTTDGETWTLEDGVRLAMDEDGDFEAEGVKDPAVAQLPDGRWLMVYVTTQPEFPLQKDS